MQACIRIRPDHQDKKSVLIKAFQKLFHLYPNEGSFYLSITCNAILVSDLGKESETFSIFYGQNHSSARNFDYEDTYKIKKLQDVSNVRTEFTADSFQKFFLDQFPDTKTTVHSLASIVFLVRKLGSFYDDPSLSHSSSSVFTTIQL